MDADAMIEGDLLDLGPEEGVVFLVFRCHDGRVIGPFATREDARHACQGQGKCILLVGIENFAWGE